MDSISRLFPAQFYHRKIGSYAIKGKRDLRDPLANSLHSLILFTLSESMVQKGEETSRLNLSLTSQPSLVAPVLTPHISSVKMLSICYPHHSFTDCLISSL
jgi:hypothetical protein